MFEKLKQGIGPVFLLPQFSHDHHRMVRFEMVMTLLVMATCAAIQSFDYTSAQAQTQTTSLAVQTPATEHTQQSSNVDPAPQASTVASTPTTMPAPATPHCRPTANASSAAVNLGSYGEGVTVLRDAPTYYQVFGNEQSTVRSQVAACGPTGEYAADASYNLNWSYALRADETGLCRVVGIKVGVRTSMVLPYRAVSGNEAASLVAKWAAFSAALTAHENGHTAIAEQYAARMMYSLQTFPAGDCYAMSPSVDATANSVVAQLRAAQSQYDSLTRHGGAQGAVF